MRMNKKALIPILVCALLTLACSYIVLPEKPSTPKAVKSKGWSAVVTNVGKNDAGDLHIDITIRNETYRLERHAGLRAGNTQNSRRKEYQL